MNELIKLGPLTVCANLAPGDGIPLLIFNSWRSPLDTLDPLVAALGERAVLRLDLPGTGGSPPLSRVLRPAQLADIAAEVASHYGIRQMDVAGYGFGGAAAQELARGHARRVRRLILMATSAGHLMFPPSASLLPGLLGRGLLRRLRRPNELLSPDFLGQIAPIIYGGAARGAQSSSLARLSGTPLHINKTRLMREAAGLAGWSSLPWLGELTQRTLILTGREDQLVHPLNAWLLQRRLAHAELHWMPGGHLFPILDCPETTAAVINRFSGHHQNVINLDAWRALPRAMH